MQKILKIVYSVLFSAIIVVAVLLLITIFPFKGNFEVKVVESGSMEPAIHTGSLVVIKPESSYQVGDVITFGPDTKTKVPTSHRIIKMHAVEGKMYYTTKGDANPSPDIAEVPTDQVIGKVLFSVPYVGYVIAAAKTPIGFAILIIVPAAVVIGDEVRKIVLEVRRLRRKKRAQQSTEEDIT